MALDFDSLYTQMLGRQGETAGLEYWKGLQQGGASDDDLMRGFMQGANKELLARTQPVTQAVSTAPTMAAYQRSPYLDSIAKDITQQSTQNLQEQVLPGLRYGAQAAGGFGSSRQGLAEAQAVERSQRSLDGSLAQLYGNDYQQDRARALAQYQSDQQYSLGLGNLALGNKQADNSYALGNKQANNSYNLGLGQLGLSSQQGNQNFYTAQRGQDLQAAALGSNLWNTGTAGYLSQGQGLQGIGGTQQAGAWDPFNNYSNLLGRYSGLGGSATGTTTQGINGASSALGGAIAGAQLGNLWSNNSALNAGNAASAAGGDGLGAFGSAKGWWS